MVVSNVYISDVWNNMTGHDDVTAAEATSGNTAQYVVVIANASETIISQVKFWIDPSAFRDFVSFEISDISVSWVTPDNEDDALELSDIAVDNSQSLLVRRVIAAGSDSNPDVLNYIQYSFTAI